MNRFSMADMASAPPSASELAHLEIQKQKQDRLMLKEKRLADTEARLERQRKDAARKEKQRISQRDRALNEERQANAQRERQRQAEIDVRIEAGVALDKASDIAGWPLEERQRDFLIEYAVQLHRAKVI